MAATGLILGGLGLLLAGMWLMTDGLKMAAGEALRGLLQSWTNTRVVSNLPKIQKFTSSDMIPEQIAMAGKAG